MPSRQARALEAYGRCSSTSTRRRTAPTRASIRRSARRRPGRSRRLSGRRSTWRRFPAPIPTRGPTCWSGSRRSRPTADPSPAGRPSSRPVYGGQGVVYNDDNLWIALGLVECGERRLAGRRSLATHASSSSSSATAGTRAVLTRARAGSSGPGKARTATGTRSRRQTRRCSRSGSTRHQARARTSPGRRAPTPGQSAASASPAGSSPTTSTSAGTSTQTTWSYNQGAMIAAAVRPVPRDRRAAVPRRRREDGGRGAREDRRPDRLGRAAGLPRDLLPRPARAERGRSAPLGPRGDRALRGRGVGEGTRPEDGPLPLPGPGGRRCSTRRRWCRSTPSSRAPAEGERC